MKKNYPKYKWKVIAHDYNSPLLRNYIWVLSFFWQAKMYKIPRVALAIVAKNNNLEYITDLDSWSAAHEVLKKRVLKDYRFYDKVIQKTIDHGEAMNRWAVKNIQQVDLTKKSSRHLIRLFHSFLKHQGEQYAHGVILPLLDFADFAFLENYLKELLKKKVSGKKFNEYYTVFTEPEHNSFALDQEISLLKLMQPFYSSKKWCRDVISKNVDYVHQHYPQFYKKLQHHTGKYAWVYYVYNGPAFTEKNFLEFIRDYLRKKIGPNKRLVQLKQERKKSQAVRLKYLRNLRPTAKERAMVELVGKMVWAKPRRKDYQSKLYWQMNKLCQEIGHRLFLSVDQVKAAPIEILEAGLIKGKKVDVNILNEINKYHVIIPAKKEGVIILYGHEARQFAKKYVKQPKKVRGLLHTTKVAGVTAYPGRARGRVKIVNEVADLGKMKQGDILVSTATTPSIVAAMKKAGAIVTDEGGLTCHASIVSRELRIPCVVGTKIATDVFKDGDKVAVDAHKGVVKKL